MEDRRTAIAILLIIMTVMMYSEMVLAPTMRTPAPVGAARSASVQGTTPQTGAAQNGAGQYGAGLRSSASGLPGVGSPVAPEQAPSPAEIRAAPSITVDTPYFIASFTTFGGRLTSFQLKDHRENLQDTRLLDMVSVPENAPLPLGIYSGLRSDLRTAYSIASLKPAGSTPLTSAPIIVAPDQTLSITLQGTLSDGSAITKTLSFQGSSYLFNVAASLEEPSTDGTSLWLEWTRFLPEAVLHDPIDPWTFTSLSDANKVQHVQLPSITLDGLSQPMSTQWIGVADKYFTATLLSDQAGFNARYGRVGPLFLHRVAGTPSEGRFSLFAGPKDYRVLQQLGNQLERSIDLGFFSFLAYPLLILIRLFHSIFHNYGLAIVGVTLLIKGLFFPLTKASLKSMKAMQDLQPEMQALRERVKDPTQLNQEMLQLYKRRGVNPMGGCLPILLQIPVFFGLYSALLHSIELRHAAFGLWIHDLSVPERLEFFGINFPIMILIMGVAMFYQQWSTPMPTIDPAQRRMMLIMSALFPVSFLIFPFPSGLALYMLTNTSISLIQQAYLRSDTHKSPGRATTLASLGIFAIAFVLTLL